MTAGTKEHVDSNGGGRQWSIITINKSYISSCALILQTDSFHSYTQTPLQQFTHTHTHTHARTHARTHAHTHCIKEKKESTWSKDCLKKSILRLVLKAGTKRLWRRAKLRVFQILTVVVVFVRVEGLHSSMKFITLFYTTNVLSASMTSTNSPTWTVPVANPKQNEAQSARA